MKIKKHISLLLAFILLVSNVGFAFNVHYCAGEVSSIEPVYLSLEKKSKSDSCCGEVVEKENKCCKNKTFHFQKKSSETIIKAFSFSPAAVFLKEDWKPLIFSADFDTDCSSVATYYCEANAPPFFKLYHQFIFYE